jgi:Tfp pilus assembly protein PilN
MAVVHLTRSENHVINDYSLPQAEGSQFARVAAGASLLAGGLLLLAGHRRSGLVTAAAGTAMAILDQQEAVKSVWHALPSFIEKAQGTIQKVEQTVIEIAQQRERLHQILSR